MKYGMNDVSREIRIVICRKCQYVMMPRSRYVIRSVTHRCSKCRSDQTKDVSILITDLNAEEIKCVQEVLKKVKEKAKEEPSEEKKKTKEVHQKTSKAPSDETLTDDFLEMIRDQLMIVWNKTGSYSRVEARARELFNKHKQKLLSSYQVHDEDEMIIRWFKP